MSTSSLIGKVLDDSGKVECIYCHSDGWVEEPGVGYILKTFYKNPKSVDKLMKLGDLSILGEIPEDDPNLWQNSENSNKCRTYKGRGDKDWQSQIYRNPKEAVENVGQSYNYFYIDGKWYCVAKYHFKGILDLETGEVIDKEKK